MRDEQIAEILTKENGEFRKLSDEHRDLDGKLTGFSAKHYLSAEEEMERKRLQKMKLMKKDRMAEIIRQYRKDHSVN
ncbi:MAG: YdcH family protein [Nitrospiraceae bacterium]|nr:YdcH family protein [Nitrospiraceae bacterium]